MIKIRNAGLVWGFINFSKHINSIDHLLQEKNNFVCLKRFPTLKSYLWCQVNVKCVKYLKCKDNFKDIKIIISPKLRIQSSVYMMLKVISDCIWSHTELVEHKKADAGRWATVWNLEEK